jgi:2-iminobutanoate/2-iminopropanoate deaminase
MAVQRINPVSMGGEPAAYSNGILVPSESRTLYIAGQIGVDAKGVASPDFAVQCRQAWANLQAVLKEAGMDLTHVVKTTIFLVNASDYATFVQIRTETLNGHKPASTLLYVSGLAKPEWKVEIEAVAVR